MKATNQAGDQFQKLVNLMDTLREQCPWDNKQTIQSLQKYSIEEMYELVDAINNNDMQELKEELGDVLFHTVFYSKIASETNDFTISDVLIDVHEKLKRRHPHIFGNIEVANVDEVKKNWEQIKLKEGKSSVLSGVPKSLPALVKAFRIQEKAAQVGFDWEQKNQVLEKVKEEINELEAAIQNKDQTEIENEFGDVLFSMINYARFLGIDPEASLEKTNRKFISRFQYIEKKCSDNGIRLNEAGIEKLEKFWNEAKRKTKT